MNPVRFGSQLRVGDMLDSHRIVQVMPPLRGEILVVLDNGRRRQFAWNQQIIN